MIKYTSIGLLKNVINSGDEVPDLKIYCLPISKVKFLTSNNSNSSNNLKSFHLNILNFYNNFPIGYAYCLLQDKEYIEQVKKLKIHKPEMFKPTLENEIDEKELTPNKEYFDYSLDRSYYERFGIYFSIEDITKIRAIQSIMISINYEDVKEEKILENLIKQTKNYLYKLPLAGYGIKDGNRFKRINLAILDTKENYKNIINILKKIVKGKNETFTEIGEFLKDSDTELLNIEITDIFPLEHLKSLNKCNFYHNYEKIDIVPYFYDKSKYPEKYQPYFTTMFNANNILTSVLVLQMCIKCLTLRAEYDRRYQDENINPDKLTMLELQECINKQNKLKSNKEMINPTAYNYRINYPSMKYQVIFYIGDLKQYEQIYEYNYFIETLYPSLASYLSITNNLTFYITNGIGNYEQTFSQLTSKKHMYLDDYLKLLDKLPRFLAKKQNNFYFRCEVLPKYVQIYSEDKSYIREGLTLKILYTSLDLKGDVEYKSINTEKIQIKSIRELYHLNTLDYTEGYKNMLNLQKDLTNVEKKLMLFIKEKNINISINALNVFNTIFFIYNGKRFVGFVKDYEFTRRIAVNSCTMDTKPFIDVLKGNNIEYFLDMRIFTDYYNVVLNFIKKEIKETKPKKKYRIDDYFSKYLVNYPLETLSGFLYYLLLDNKLPLTLNKVDTLKEEFKIPFDSIALWNPATEIDDITYKNIVSELTTQSLRDVLFTPFGLLTPFNEDTITITRDMFYLTKDVYETELKLSLEDFN